MKWLRRTIAIAAKEFRQLRRDRLTGGMVVGIPILQIVLFGYAINMDVRHLPIAVADQADTSLSRQVVQNIVASQVVDLEYVVGSGKEIEKLLQEGKVMAGLVIPPDFERRLQDPSRAAGQLMVDASDPIISGIAQRLQGLVPSGENAPEALSERSVPFLEIRAFYNPERRTEVQIVPGLIGVILTLTMVLFTSVALVREKERGNIEFLITTPVRSIELMIGKITPYILIGLIQVALILFVGDLLFDVPIRGSLLDLYLGALAFVAASLTLGLLISTFANSQFQAFQMTLLIFLPSLLLSGFMFPFDGMPKWAQWIAEVLPLTHFLRIIRGIMLRGAELSQLAGEVWAILAFFAVTMALSILTFRKRLD
ncbi:MAG: ABC transporter permease [Alphaproteobacteria bacterium]|nr:MAG: ABC transporter permease [Alphaproteobacteria bacterium]